MITNKIKVYETKEEAELIRNLSARIKELLEKVEKKTWNEATLYAFQVGLSGDVEDAFKKLEAKRKYWELKYKKEKEKQK